MLRLTMEYVDILPSHVQSKSDCLPHWFCDKSCAQVAVCTIQYSSVFMTYILHCTTRVNTQRQVPCYINCLCSSCYRLDVNQVNYLVCS